MRSLQVLKKILSNRHHIIFLLAAMVCVGIGAVLLSNNDVVRAILLVSAFSGTQKLAFLLSLFSDPMATYGAETLAFFLVIDFLFVLNLLVLHQLFKERFFIRGRSVVLNLSALFTAIIGLGCFSCGSVLLFFFLSIFGITVSSAFGSLWNGAETWMPILSIVLFLISISISLKKLVAPPIC